MYKRKERERVCVCREREKERLRECRDIQSLCVDREERESVC